ncbi:MAG: hypothetical protein EBZ36_01530 [Acidobacteria bacterium]|nr:hypothetical protein [Acidobacteriota bacterium]
MRRFTCLMASIFLLPVLSAFPNARFASEQSQSQIEVIIHSPVSNRVITNELYVGVEVKTPYELNSVTARIWDQDFPLTFSRCVPTRNNQCINGYEAKIPTTGRAYGTYQLRVTARNVYGESASAQTNFTINRPPQLTMISPLTDEVARASIRVEATCEDDDPEPCGEAQITFGSMLVMRTRTPINTEVSLEQFQGKSDSLCVSINEPGGQGTDCRRIFVETSPHLIRVNSFDGTILDVRDDRILVNERRGSGASDTVLRVYHRSTGVRSDIFTNPVVGTQLIEPYAMCNYLTETGAVFLAPGNPRQLIREWRDDRLTTIGQTGSYGVCSANGRYVSWHGTEAAGTSGTPVGMITFDLVTGTVTRIANDTSFWQFSTGRDGSVAYWLNNQIHRYSGGQSVRISNNSEYSGAEPRTDGEGVVYKGGGLRLWSPNGESLLSAAAPFTINNRYHYYVIENGRVAFPRPGASGGMQVWLRDIATGAEVQQHFVQAESYPDSLSAGGRVTYVITRSVLSPDPRRYITVAGRPQEVGSTLGKPFWLGERLYIAIGGTLFLFNPDLTTSPPVPAPDLTTIIPSAVTAGSAGLNLTVEGSNFTTGSVVRWNGQNRPTVFVNSNRLTASIQTADLATPGRGEVAVYVPESGGLVTAPRYLTIESNPRTVRAVASGGSIGGEVSVPLEFEAQGNEAAVGFSLTYDPAILGSPQVQPGGDTAGMSLTVNAANAARGRIGILIGLPSGRSFAAGTRRLATVTFQIAGGIGATSTRIDFDDQPIRREMVDTEARRMATVFTGTTIGIGQGFEGDVSPRPLGSGTLTAADLVQVGRMVAGIDLVGDGGEYVRADCAPRSTLGDGRLSLADWVQSARYASQLDPPTVAGGPAGAGAGSAASQAGIGLALESSSAPARIRLRPGASGVWSVEIDSPGQENAIAFSVRFDQSRLSFDRAEPAPGATGASLLINQHWKDRGSLGVMVAMPAGQTVASGRQELLRLTFSARGQNGSTSPSLNFADYPIRREVIGPLVEPLAADFVVQHGTAELSPATVVSAADYGDKEVPRGGIVSVFGQRLAGEVRAALTRPLPDTLGGTRVAITDSKGLSTSAQLFYASPGQLNLLLPDGISSGPATAIITNENGDRSFAILEIVDVAPSLFTANGDGKGVVAGLVIHVSPDGTRRTKEIVRFDPVPGRFTVSPIDLASDEDEVYLALFGTGIRFRNSQSTVTVRIGEKILPTSYAGAQGEYAGLDQINLLLPRSLRGLGETSLSVLVDGRESTRVRIGFR